VFTTVIIFYCKSKKYKYSSCTVNTNTVVVLINTVLFL